MIPNLIFSLTRKRQEATTGYALAIDWIPTLFSLTLTVVRTSYGQLASASIFIMNMSSGTASGQTVRSACFFIVIAIGLENTDGSASSPEEFALTGISVIEGTWNMTVIAVGIIVG